VFREKGGGEFRVLMEVVEAKLAGGCQLRESSGAQNSGVGFGLFR